MNAREPRSVDPWVEAGVAASALIEHPDRWINRRVETVEMLAMEQVRRRVSVDFTLSLETQRSLMTPDGVVVPISALTKEARRGFDLRDEGGASVPVLGKELNGLLAHIAIVEAVSVALPGGVSADDLSSLSGDLKAIVFEDSEPAATRLAAFATADDPVRRHIWWTLRPMLSLLVENYVLFAVLPGAETRRRVLKYGYDEPFPRTGRTGALSFVQEAPSRLRRPDRQVFEVDFPGAWRASSFHAEIIVPEELRIDTAYLYDRAAERDVGGEDTNVDRASLYAEERVAWNADLAAILVVSPERAGLTARAGAASIVVALLLWSGALAGLKKTNADAAVSLLLAAAALYSGVLADHGEHRLVKSVFRGTRRSLAIVALAALTASASLAMQIPAAEPVGVWTIAAGACTLAAIRLAWSACRAAG